MKSNDSATLFLPGIDLQAPAGPVEKTESQKLFDAERIVLESQARKLEVERRAIAARHLCHDWSAGLKRYGVRHAVSMDMVRDHLGIEKAVRKSRYSYANNINGFVFHNNNGKEGEKFVKLGYIKSKAEGSHGNMILLWTLAKYEHVARSMFNHSPEGVRV